MRAGLPLSEIIDTPVVRSKPIVGINAFAHEAGIHQHGMMADPSTYEIMRHQDMGFEGTWFVLGKHSGCHAVASAPKPWGGRSRAKPCKMPSPASSDAPMRSERSTMRSCWP